MREDGLSPQHGVLKAVYVMNHLRLAGTLSDPPALTHYSGLQHEGIMLVSLQTKDSNGYQQNGFIPGLRRTLWSLILPMKQQSLILQMKQQPVLPENNHECFCCPWMRLESVGCGSDGWYEFKGRSFPRCLECRHWHTQEYLDGFIPRDRNND